MEQSTLFTPMLEAAADEHRRLERNLAVAQRLSAALALGTDGQLQEFLAACAGHFEVEMALVSRIDMLQRRYSVEHCWTAEPELSIDQYLELGDAYCEATVRADDVVVIDDAVRTHAEHPSCAVRGLCCYIGAPVRVHGELYGTLSLSGMSIRSAQWTDADVWLMRLCAHSLGKSLELRSAMDELRAARVLLEESTRSCALTGLLNRRNVLEQATREVIRARRYGTPLSIALVDVDAMKHINDTAGHSAGDKVLRRVGALLHSLLREVDLAGRFGGEEFLLVLPNTPAEAASVPARRILEAIRDTEAEPGLRATVSIGIAGVLPSESLAALMERAEVALRRAKAAGGDSFVISSEAPMTR
jgi:diguanylate cyclase (GGDEF)-like protein